MSNVINQINQSINQSIYQSIKSEKCDDLLSVGSWNEISERNRYSNDTPCQGLEGNGNILLKCSNSSDISKLDRDVVFMKYNNLIVVNPDKDSRLCRTIKAQYWKNGLSNIFHKDGTFGCTGVIVIEYEQ